ncbi:MAG: hypothetical protein BWK75_05395 [Candidatus Altiarchaeales archaeon A3]|nr:MAG: hypothetical protein BWK75_05395 [Candidatus Altiarchaeales archaeon A3]
MVLYLRILNKLKMQKFSNADIVSKESTFMSLNEINKEEELTLNLFLKNNEEILEGLKNDNQKLYLISGERISGKTTILKQLFNKAHFECKKESIFIKGKYIFLAKRFFDLIGIKGRNSEDWRSVDFRDFNKIIFIDDFDKMLDNLGEDFSAFLRAKLQEHETSIISTTTLRSVELRKHFLSYSAPFYRFFIPFVIGYTSEDIKYLCEKINKDVGKDIEQIKDMVNNNIKLLWLLVENYEGNINKTIQNILPKISMNDFLEGTTAQQQEILDYVCRGMINEGKEHVSIKEIVEYISLPENVVRAQINKMLNIHVIKRIKQKRKSYFVVNKLLLEKKKEEITGEHNNLGSLLKNLKRYDEAEKEYREAIRINPNDAEAHYNLGILLKNLKRYDEAENAYREAIRINPNDAEAHNNLGVLLYNLKRYEEAENAYREAIKINPNYANARNNLGSLLYNLKRYEEAEKEYREAIINPNDAEAHYNLGVLLYDLKRYDEAEKEYRVAIRINPNDAEAHNNLGVLLQKLNRYEEAEKEWREVIRINPNDAYAHHNLEVL